jgi:hypothetical protein
VADYPNALPSLTRVGNGVVGGADASTDSLGRRTPLLQVTCEECGSEFGARQRNQRHCSTTCQVIAKRNTPRERDCDSCGARFQPPQHRSRTCSRTCAQRLARAAAAPARPSRPCATCGDDFQPFNQRHRFCSPACSKERAHLESLLRITYGLTFDEYQAMAEAQGNRCAICRQEDTTRLAIDHDHETGKVRGLLCRRCNIALGLLGDDASQVMAAAAYLIEHGR